MPVTSSLITSGVSALGGGLQALFSGKRKAEKDLEGYANSYQPNGSVLDYYNKALAKYSANPYTSQSYQNRTNQIQRNLATGIGASQDRRGGLATVGSLTQGADDQNANAAAQAENQQNANLSQLGNATQMKSAEDSKKYDMLYNLKALKASAANQQNAQGLSNLFNGLGNAGKVLGTMADGDNSSSNGVPKLKRSNLFGQTTPGSYLSNGLSMGTGGGSRINSDFSL